MFEFVKQALKPQFILIVLAVIVGVYYPQVLKTIKRVTLDDDTNIEDASPVKYESAEHKDNVERLFTKTELAKYNGENEDVELYLAILGSVYDVSRGKKHYGLGCGYNFFVGRDASVSFITGEFENFDEHKADDVLILKPKDLLSLANWKKFYDKDYIYRGKLIGRFYDESGEPTAYHHKYMAMLEKAQESKAAMEELKKSYPDCNIEWSVEKGTRVWCTRSSGGGEGRDWIGYPRKLFEMGSDTFRCACVREEELDTTTVMLKPYDDCDRLSNECFYKVD